MRTREDTVTLLCSIFVLLTCLVALGGVVCLAFVFPHVVESWAESGRKLSQPEMLTANLGNFCKTYGLILIPALFLCLAGAILWVGRVVFRPDAEDCPDPTIR